MKKQKSNPAKTVLTISMGFLVLYFIGQWQWALVVSGVVGITGVFSEYLSKKIEWLWMKLAWLLSLIIPKILLSAVFYLLLFPIALLARVFQKSDPLMLKNKQSSTFKEKTGEFDKASFEKTW